MISATARRPRISAVHRGLQRDVGVPEHRQVAQAHDHGQPVARDERVDHRDHDRQRHRERRRAPHLAAQAGGDPGADDRHHDRSQRDRAGQQQRRARERHAIRTSGACAGGVQRAGPAPVAHCAPWSGHRQVRLALHRQREVVCKALGRQGIGGRRDAGRVGAGDKPGRRRGPLRGGRDQSGAGAQSADRLAVRIEQLQRVAAGEPRIHPAGRRPVGDQDARERAVQVTPGADQHRERVRPRSCPEQLRGGRHAGGLELRRDLLARVGHVGRALERRGQPAPLEPMHERLGKRADHGGTSSVAVQSCRSHQIRSPRCTAVLAAPTLASIPLT